MNNISYLAAFGGGLVSFFAPCVLPLFPVYLAYVTGVSAEDINSAKPIKKRLFLTGVSYTIGFTIVFVLLGAAASGVGGLLRENVRLIQVAGGLLIIFFGLEFAQIGNFSFLAKVPRINITLNVRNYFLRGFLLGVLFGVTWSPCIGALLGAILTLAAVSGSLAQGATLLLVYSLGLSLPFLLFSVFLAQAKPILKLFQRKTRVISVVSGLFMIALGILLVFDLYKYLNSWIFDLAISMGYEIK